MSAQAVTDRMSAAIWAGLSDAARARALELETAFRVLTPPLRGERGSLTALAAAMRGRDGWSLPTLIRLYYAWRRAGRAGLVDHNRCGGCGLPGCRSDRAGRTEEAVTDALAEECWARAGRNATRRGLAAAARSLVRDLGAGRSVPGAGTWQQLYQRLNPGAPLPPACPWSERVPPPGWSESRFRGFRPARAELALTHGGHLAVNSALWTPEMDTSHLRPLEYVVFDDKRIDVLVWAGGQLAEPWCLFAMDVATRKILAYGVRFRVRRPDGKKDSITRRDMMHCIAGVYGRYGIPKAHNSHLVTENASAAVETADEHALTLGSDGRIVVHRTLMTRGSVFSSGFASVSGSPSSKGWIESYFNLLDTESGAVMRGQTGARWDLKPADHEAKKAHALEMIKAGQNLPIEERRRLRLPFMDAAEFLTALRDLVDRLDARSNHRIKGGFREIREWRYGPSDTEWRPLADLSQFPPEAAEALLRANGRTRVESPSERFSRLYDAADYEALGPAVAAMLLFDAAPVTYGGGNRAEITRKKRTWRFYGRDHEMEEGAEYTARCNLDDPASSGVHFVDAAGRYRGRMSYDTAARYGDAADAEAVMIRKRQELSAAARRVKTRDYSPERAESEIAALDLNLAILHNAAPPEAAGLKLRDAAVAMADDTARRRDAEPRCNLEAEVLRRLAAGAREPDAGGFDDFDF